MSAAKIPRATAGAGLLHRDSTVFLVCDVQERFRDLIFQMPSVIKTSRLMVRAGKELGVPVVATEQYPKALLRTVDELELSKHNVPVFEKMLFSMLTPEVERHIEQLPGPAKKSFVIVGLETHVCVQQTCLDLLERGADVHIVVDGVSSQRPLDRAVALNRMASAGAYLTSAESVCFMLMREAKFPNFKAVSNLFKEYGNDPSLLPFGNL